MYFFVLILAFSRRIYVRTPTDEQRDSWFAGMERAFRHFRGLTQVVLLDDSKAPMKSQDGKTRSVVFLESFKAFATYRASLRGAAPPTAPEPRAKTVRSATSSVIR